MAEPTPEQKAEAAVTALESNLDNLEELLKPLLAVEGSYRDCADQLDPKEHARLQAAVAYVLNSSYFMYLRARGLKTGSHPVRQDLLRVQNYFKKHFPQDAAEAEESGAKSRPALDVDAAARIIRHKTSRPKEQHQGQRRKGKKR